MVRLRILSAMALLAFAILACDLPALTTKSPQPPLDQAGTSVAQTLAPVSSPAASPAATETATASATPALLPHSVYFENNDKNGLLQIFRIGKDGKNTQQITFEPAPVEAFDVSPKDGSVAFTSNNQLFLVDATGAGRKLLVDGGPVDDNTRFTNSVGSPVWAPDASKLAFSHNGLSFYDMATGAISSPLQNKIDTTQGFPIVGELYAPDKYSPDGSKLLVSITFNEGGTWGLYQPSDNTLIRLNNPEGDSVCCDIRWVPDSSGLYAANDTIGVRGSGLWFIKAADGTVTTLIPGSAPDGTYNFAWAPQVGNDGQLYFFFNNLPQIPTTDHTPLYLVHSGTDGVTGRTKVGADTFQNLNEVLWAADGSLAIVADGATPDVLAGGQAEIVYADGRPSATLTSFAEQMHWGP